MSNNIKISELNELTTVTGNDFLPIVDSGSNPTTYKVSVSTLLSAIKVDYVPYVGLSNQALYSTQSLFSTQSLYSTHSLISSQSIYSTSSTISSQSLNSISASLSSFSIFAETSTFSTQSIDAFQSLYSTQSIQSPYSTYSTNSLSSKSSSFASRSIYTIFSSTASCIYPQPPLPAKTYLITENMTFPLSTIKASSLEKQMPVTISLIGGGAGGGGSGGNGGDDNHDWDKGNYGGGGGGAIILIKLSPFEVYHLKGDLVCSVGYGGIGGRYVKDPKGDNPCTPGAAGGDTYITINNTVFHGAKAGGGKRPLFQAPNSPGGEGGTVTLPCTDKFAVGGDGHMSSSPGCNSGCPIPLGGSSHNVNRTRLMGLPDKSLWKECNIFDLSNEYALDFAYNVLYEIWDCKLYDLSANDWNINGNNLYVHGVLERLYVFGQGGLGGDYHTPNYDGMSGCIGIKYYTPT